jgi:hypothetical protein
MIFVALCLFVVVAIYVGAHSKGRGLTDTEIMLATSIYGGDIDLSSVHLVFDSVYCLFAPVTLGNTIHINTKWAQLDTTSDLTGEPSAHHVLLHELEHVSQYQHGGWSYLLQSLFAQTIALVSKGSRNEAYRWEERIADNTPFEEWNPEEQAQGISDFEYYVLSGNGIGTARAELAKALACAVPVLKSRYCDDTEGARTARS